MTTEDRIEKLEKRLEKLEKQVGSFQNATFLDGVQVRNSRFTATEVSLAKLADRVQKLEEKK